MKKAYHIGGMIVIIGEGSIDMTVCVLIASLCMIGVVSAASLTPGTGSPLKPEEIILIGKLRRAVQRREWTGSLDLQAAFASVDKPGNGKLAWSEVARVLHAELKLAIASEG